MEEDILDFEVEPQTESENDESVAMPDIPDTDPNDPMAHEICGLVDQKFKQSESQRYVDEQRWLLAYRNYRGEYGPDVQFTESEKSRVFIKITKTKVLAAYGQLIDVLFGGDKFPIGVSPTSMPEGVEEAVHFDMQPTSGPDQPAEKDQTLLPGETLQSFRERLGPAEEKLGPVMDELKPGQGTTQTQITYHPAEMAAQNMQKRIHDQLEESGASKQLRSTAFEATLFGTGLMKGPFIVEKEYAKWGEEGQYEPVVKTMPMTSHVSIWNSYPDPDADNMEEAEYFIERHKLSRSKFRSLKKRPFFRSNAIDQCLELGSNYIEKWWESLIDDDETSIIDRFEVLEFWGFVDTEMVEKYDVEIPERLKDDEQVSVNIWVCNGRVLRFVVNPYTPTYIPYYAVPYELNPYSFFGVGVAENMEDTQLLMNGFMRMAIDNAALSGNLIFEIDEANIVPGQDLKMYPGKVFRRQSGAPGQALFATEYPNVSNQNMQLFDKARVLADESTGIPSFSHGQTGVQGVGRTSSGISMLMSAANGSVRTVVKNIDDYLLAPLGKSLYHFNMQFNFDKDIAGDLEIKARGTESLMANEVRSQRLMQFLSVVQNPVLAPFAKMDYIIQEIAKSMELDPSKVVNNLSDAAIQAKILEKFQAQAGEQPAPGAEGGPPAVSDPTGAGDGSIGVGSAPTPGEQGFSGNVS